MTAMLSDEYGPLFADDAGPALAASHTNARPVEPMLPREVKVLVLVLQDRRGRKTYERMLNDGWSVDSTTARTLSRAQTVTFSRAKMSRADRKLVAKMNRRHA